MGKWYLHASLFLGNKDMFKNYKRFDFWHVQTADIGGTKPWRNNCSLIWKLFKFLMTLLAGLFEMRGCWHIGLRWVIVALWATCVGFVMRWLKWLNFKHPGSLLQHRKWFMPHMKGCALNFLFILRCILTKLDLVVYRLRYYFNVLSGLKHFMTKLNH